MTRDSATTTRPHRISDLAVAQVSRGIKLARVALINQTVWKVGLSGFRRCI